MGVLCQSMPGYEPCLAKTIPSSYCVSGLGNSAQSITFWSLQLIKCNVCLCTYIQSRYSRWHEPRGVTSLNDSGWAFMWLLNCGCMKTFWVVRPMQSSLGEVYIKQRCISSFIELDAKRARYVFFGICYTSGKEHVIPLSWQYSGAQFDCSGFIISHLQMHLMHL